tara:strand:+ start:367 stop:498 length:132 start_codon:yes stop_codon:yes gene_type:complete
MSNTLAYAGLGQRKKKKTVKKKPIRNMKDLSKAVLGRKRGGKA